MASKYLDEMRKYDKYYKCPSCGYEGEFSDVELEDGAYVVCQKCKEMGLERVIKNTGDVK